MTEDEAKAIALQHAGLQQADARFVKAVRYQKQGVWLYELIFMDSHSKYRYLVDTNTGNILDHYIYQLGGGASQPAEPPASTLPQPASDNPPAPASSSSTAPASASSTPAPAPENPAATPPAATGTISAEQAQAIAAGHSSVPAGEMRVLEIKLEKEDGVLVYDVEFTYGGTEYDYEIDAATGAILDWDMDEADDD